MTHLGAIATVLDDGSDATGAAVAAGAYVGRFQVAGVLGSGGMGVVLAVYDPQLDRKVALKLLAATPEARWTEARIGEARAMAQLAHPNVVTVHEAGFVDATPYLVMELVPGGTLRTWMTERARGWREVLAMMTAAGAGLAAAHRAGVVHRDFKPENVLVGDDGRPRVSDFGLASLGAVPGVRGGTRGYMAPEQIAGERVDARADQYAFCVTLWEALHGVRPGERPIVPRANRRAPAWLYRALLRGLRARPDERWPSLPALLAELERPRRRPAGWVTAALVACGAVVALAGALHAHAPGRPPPLRLVQLTHRRDLRNAQISPDGATLAFIAGDALIVRGVDPDAADRVVVAHGIHDAALSWSPDGTRIAVAVAPNAATVLQTDIVDLATGARSPLRVPGMAAFLGNDELAVTAYRRRDVELVPVAGGAVTSCGVPGDYHLIWSIDGLPDGTMVVRTGKGSVGSVVILGHDCHVRATYTADHLISATVTDTGTVIALVAGDGASELIELSLDGVVRSRRRSTGELVTVNGRRHGIDYVLTFAYKTELQRVKPGGHTDALLSQVGAARFALDPRGETLAWIELGTAPHGPLRLSTIDGLALRGRSLLDHAMNVAWSPDGESLATLVDADGPALVVVDRHGGPPQRLALHALDAAAAPVWLDDHRVAAETADHLTYVWFDLRTRQQGELVARDHGPTIWLARSPRDGTLAMWRSGAPGATGRDAAHLWLARPGDAAAPLALVAPPPHVLMPSWTPGGELLVRVFETGAVLHVALDTGVLTPVAQLTATELDVPPMILPDGALLTAEHDVDINVATIAPE